jgi:predicted nucleotidyltransferase
MKIEVVDLSARIAVPAEAIEEFCRNRGIREIALFGSVLRDDFGPDSDVDVLIEFRPGAKRSLFGLERMSQELQALAGRRVDLVTKGGLSPHLAGRILRNREVVYHAVR